MDPKRWSSQLPPSLSTAFPSTSTSDFVQNRSYSLVSLRDWPFASESTVGLDESSNVFAEDLKELRTLDDVLQEGRGWIQRLYGIRCVSKALPQVMSEEFKLEIHRGSYEILKPRLLELLDLIAFSERAVQKFCNSASFLMHPARRKRTLPKAVLSRMVALVDVVVTLDHVKDMKTPIQNDISAFKRALGFLKTKTTDLKEKTEMNRVETDVARLHLFLTSQMSTLSTNLKRALHAVPGDHTEIVNDLFTFCLTELESERFLHPEEKFCLIRFLPHALFLMDSTNETGYKPCNAFKQKKMTGQNVKDLFRRYPICPLYADMHISLIYVLERCPNFKQMVDANPMTLVEWGGVLPAVDLFVSGQGAEREKTKTDAINAEKLREDKRNYEITSYWKQVRSEFDEFSCRFASCARRVKMDATDAGVQEKHAQDAAGSAGQETAEARRRRLRLEALDREVYEVSLEGLKLLGKWKEWILAHMAFKYSKGADSQQQEGMNTTVNSTESNNGAFSEYDRVIRLNHTPLELTILFDSVCTIKSLACLMEESSALFAMPIRRRIHLEIQEFAQLRLLRMSHSVHQKKSKQNTLALLTQLRSICLDWFTGVNNVNDFKEKKVPRKLKEFEKKSGLGGEDDPEHAVEQTGGGGEEEKYLSGPPRAVGPSSTQLCLLRAFVETLRDPDKSDSLLEKSLSLFTSADIDRTQGEILKDFYNRSFFYPYLLSLETCLKKNSDLSFLWHREFYLEMTKQVQFPISSSLPWIVLKEMLTSSASNTSMIDSVLFFLDIYNDAAQFALLDLKQGFLFDEIEAEGKLVFEQFVFLLGDTLYTHYKSVNAGRILDKSYRAKLQELKRSKSSTGRSGGLGGLSAALLTSPFGSAPTTTKSGQKYLEIDHKRYSALLSERAFRFLGRTIDLSKLLADHLNVYLRADLELVFTRFEGSGLSASRELELLLICLRSTHEDFVLKEKLILDDFPSLVAQTDERVGAGQAKTRLARFASKELIFEVMGNYCFNSVTDRFVRAPSMGESKKSKIQGPPNFLFGKNFRDAFARAFVLESEFIAVGHLDALLRSTSFGMHDAHAFTKFVAAYIAAELCDREVEILKDLIPVLESYGKQMGKAPSSSSISSSEQYFSGAQAHAAFDAQIKQQQGVVYDEQRKKTLQLLREFGNGLVLLRMLNTVSDATETEAFVQTSHLTGLDTFFLAGSDQVAPPSVVEMTPAVVKTPGTAEDEAMYMDQVALNLDSYRPSPLLRNSFQILLNFVKQNSQALVAFPRVFNALQFSFASTAGGLPNAVPVKEDDETELGDGFLWAGYFVLFALNAKAKFELIDLCSHVARADALERCAKSDEGSMKEQAASSNVNAFLRCVRDTLEPTKALVFSSLSRLFQEEENEQGNEQQATVKRDKVVLFHPVGGFFDEATGELRKIARVVETPAAAAPTTRRASAAPPAAAPPPPPRTVSVNLSAAGSSGPPPPPPRTVSVNLGNPYGAAPPPPPRTTMPADAAPPPPPRPRRDVTETEQEQQSGPPAPPVRRSSRPPTVDGALPARPPRARTGEQ